MRSNYNLNPINSLSLLKKDRTNLWSLYKRRPVLIPLSILFEPHFIYESATIQRLISTIGKWLRVMGNKLRPNFIIEWIPLNYPRARLVPKSFIPQGPCFVRAFPEK